MVSMTFDTSKEDPAAKALAHKLQVLGKVGQGAFGTVFRAIYDGQVVAVKVLTADGNGPAEQDAKKMFFREALALQKCQHKWVPGNSPNKVFSAHAPVGPKPRGPPVVGQSCLAAMLRGSAPSQGAAAARA